MGPSPTDLDRHRSVVEQLRTELTDRVATALPREAGSVALVDFPMHENVGDLAIWAGELAVLDALGVEVAYACDVFGYRRERVERTLPPGAPVLLHGGGNFGDAWPGFQAFRERVIADFPDRPVLQLPQTIHFEDPAGIARTRSVLQDHGGVTVLVRDEASLRIARDRLDVPAVACPDAAFALRPGPPGPPTEPVVWLRRRDHEAVGEDVRPPAGVAAVDWPDHWSFAALRTLGRLHRRTTARVPVVAPVADRVLAGLYASAARRRTSLGLGMLGAGEIVVTDRLHAHVLCCLLGRPHVVVDNTYGKVSGFVDRWTSASPLVHRAAGHADGLRLAAALRDG